ncbi:MAG TPA: ABC transporter substrate binding protein [Pseudolabrys sp.]|nr:ABC transporter substrate binding protein [Pseudolabrys sp.]
MAADLIRSRVDVIIAVQTPAAQAAKNATRDIPIVVMAGDPIATGLISCGASGRCPRLDRVC